VYQRVRWSSRGGRPYLRVEVRARGGSRGRCSECGEPGAAYDHAQARWYEYVPLWGFAVFWVYAWRRVNCQRCGVKVEAVPWVIGKRSLSKSYMQFLATRARRLSGQEVAIFHTCWEKVLRSVEGVVSERSADLSRRCAAFHARQRSAACFTVASAPHRE